MHRANSAPHPAHTHTHTHARLPHGTPRANSERPQLLAARRQTTSHNATHTAPNATFQMMPPYTVHTASRATHATRLPRNTPRAAHQRQTQHTRHTPRAAPNRHFHTHTQTHTHTYTQPTAHPTKHHAKPRNGTRRHAPRTAFHTPRQDTRLMMHSAPRVMILEGCGGEGKAAAEAPGRRRRGSGAEAVAHCPPHQIPELALHRAAPWDSRDGFLRFAEALDCRDLGKK